MSSEGMDSNSEVFEQDGSTPVMEASATEALVAREWPGVSRESAAAPVKFPGEDGGKSLAKMAERDLDAALQLLAERAQYITGATGAAIALRDGDEMVCRASAGGSAPEIGARLQMDSGLSGESIQTRQMLRCDDAQTDDRVNKESCEALGIASVIVMPMLDGGEVIGVFELFSDHAYAFEERDITALERMGAMVRTAIEQAEVAGSANGGSEAHVEQAAAIAIKEPEADRAVEIPEPPVPSSAATPPASDVTSTFEDPAAPSFVMQAKQAIEEQAEGVTAIPVSAEGALPEMGKEAAHEPLVVEAAVEEPAVEVVEDAPFLSVPGANGIAPAEEPTKEGAPVEPEVEQDIGEIARDAAARTAAFKASLFAQEAPAVTEARPERVAFHMRVPARKIDSRPIEEEVPATLASAAEGPAKTEWKAPGIEDLVAQDLVTQEAAAPEPAPAEPKKVDSDASAKEAGAPPPAIAAAAPRIVAVTGGGAAVAPAREATAKTTGAAPQVREKVQSTPASPAPVKPAQPDLKKAKVEVARPASSEGRLRIAVSQVRKCEACGFPVSEGRKLCLDCEKKKAKVETIAAKTVAPVAPAAAQSSQPEAVSPKPAASARVETAALVMPEAQPVIEASVATSDAVVVEEKSVSNPEMQKKGEASPAAREQVAELPTPHFAVSAPDHYESWIVAHMYTAVAIAVVVVGIVVYLLSR